jgi:hypothetical protein
MKAGKLHHRTRDLSGCRFGCLTALRPDRSDGRKRFWLFRCDCGKQRVKVGSDVLRELKRGGTPNCGCKTGALIGAANTKHGMTAHPIYWVWRSMRDRCRLPTHQSWKNYGGRGIRVCRRWRAFESFLADMWPTYREGLSIERRDNNRGYSRENCTWVTRDVQACNRRNNVFVRLKGRRLTVAQTARETGIGVTTLLYRIAHGWPATKLLMRPDPTNRVACSTSRTAGRANAS